MLRRVSMAASIFWFESQGSLSSPMSKLARCCEHGEEWNNDNGQEQKQQVYSTYRYIGVYMLEHRVSKIPLNKFYLSLWNHPYTRILLCFISNLTPYLADLKKKSLFLETQCFFFFFIPKCKKPISVTVINPLNIFFFVHSTVSKLSWVELSVLWIGQYVYIQWRFTLSRVVKSVTKSGPKWQFLFLSFTKI